MSGVPQIGHLQNSTDRDRDAASDQSLSVHCLSWRN